MWDLESIIRQNNQAAVDVFMKGRAVEVAQSPQPKAWTLSLLAEKLRVGPPLLSQLLGCFTNYETLESFLLLIRQFLPEHEEEILSESSGQRVYRFCYLFGERYFPLPIYTSNATVDQLVAGMPIELLAFSYSVYHELDLRQAYLLLLSLVIYPYEGDERDEEDDDVPFNPFDPMRRSNMEAKFGEIATAEETKTGWRPKASDVAWVKDLIETLGNGGKWFAPMGFTFIKIDDRNIELRQADNKPEVRETVRRTVLIAEKAGFKVKVKVGKTAQEKTGKTLMEIFSGARVPLLDAVQQAVGEDLARLIPKDGWTAKDLHLWTDGTPYDGVGDFADWVCSQTGCIILDCSYEDCEFIEGMVEPIFKWTQRNVNTLTKEWPKVKEVRAKIDRVVEWLEADPISRFRELLEFLMAKAKRTRKKTTSARAKHFYDPTEHWCPLDQYNEYEEEYDYGEDDDAGETAGGDTRLRRATIDDIAEALEF